MKWIIDGRWLHKKTKKVYRAKAQVITNSRQDPVKVFHDNYDMSGMTYLGGMVTREESEPIAWLLTPLAEE